MRFGWCDTLDHADRVKRAGSDFVELPLARCGLEDRESLAAAKQAIARCPLPPAAFNNFLPMGTRLTGPDVDEAWVRDHVLRAAELLHAARSAVIVFGSGWARTLPAGWARARGEEQLLRFLSLCADALKGTGVTLVIEPLNRKESNIINSVAEAVDLARQIGRSEIRVLADFYHMDEEREPFEELIAHAPWLAHVHVADTGRLNPGTGAYDYPGFFGCLKAAGYSGMVSVECQTPDDPETEMPRSIAFLRRAWDAVHPASGPGSTPGGSVVA